MEVRLCYSQKLADKRAVTGWMLPFGADVFVHSGDFAKRLRPHEYAKACKEFNTFLGALPHKHKLFVAGNHVGGGCSVNPSPANWGCMCHADTGGRLQRQVEGGDPRGTVQLFVSPGRYCRARRCRATVSRLRIWRAALLTHCPCGVCVRVARSQVLWLSMDVVASHGIFVKALEKEVGAHPRRYGRAGDSHASVCAV